MQSKDDPNREIVYAIESVARALNANPFNQQAWVAPTFQNSWVNYGSPWATAAYYKDAVGVVHLRGLVKNGTSMSTIFTLPAGYRPQASIRFAVDSSGAFGSVYVQNDGQVVMAVGSTSFIDLATVSFRADN